MVKVLIVSLDHQWSTRIIGILSREGGYSVVAIATNLMDAYNVSEEQSPDLIFVAQEFTRLAEFEMMIALFGSLKARWLIVTDGSEKKYEANWLSSKVNSGIISVDVSDNSTDTIAAIQALTKISNGRIQIRPNRKEPLEQAFNDVVVLLGASTGGVDALSRILESYPPNCPPTVIVQHTRKNFGTGLVDLLDRLCPAKVVSATQGMAVQSGIVYLAVGEHKHLQITSRFPHTLRLVEDTQSSLHVPSIDALFKSAVPLSKRVIAGVLTGMGRDGADGLLELRRAGGVTFSQDERSSTVYGMPKIAWETGASEAQIPITKVTEHIMSASLKHSTKSKGLTHGL